MAGILLNGINYSGGGDISLSEWTQFGEEVTGIVNIDISSLSDVDELLFLFSYNTGSYVCGCSLLLPTTIFETTMNYYDTGANGTAELYVRLGVTDEVAVLNTGLFNTQSVINNIKTKIFYRRGIASGGNDGASELNELTDVNITSPQDGNVLKYNTNTSKWENAAGGGGGTVDEALSPSSTNAVQNSAIYNAIANNLYGGNEYLEVYNVPAKQDYYAGDTLCYIDTDNTLKVAKVTEDISEGDSFEFYIENLNLLNNIPYLLGVTYTTPEDIIVIGRGSPRPFSVGDKVLAINPPNILELVRVTKSINTGDVIYTADYDQNVEWLPSVLDYVKANPSDTATESLTKLQIGNDIYSVSGGGGASALADLSDVTISASPVNNSFLRLNNGVWNDEEYNPKNDILSSLFNISNYRWHPFSFRNTTDDEKISLSFLGEKAVYISFLRSYIVISDSATKSTIIPMSQTIDLSEIYTTGPLAGLKLTIFITVEDGISYINIKKSTPINLYTYNVSGVFNLLYN